MKFQGAVITEQGITFAIVIVKNHIINNKQKAIETIESFVSVFPGIPIILMAQNTRGVPIYYGRDDIARFMAKVPLTAIPWKEYTI